MLCTFFRMASERNKKYSGIFMLSVDACTGMDGQRTTLPSPTKDAHHCATPHIKNAKIRENYGEIGQIVEYTCNYRYSRCKSDENKTITCLPDGQWSPPPGLCHSYMWPQILTGQLNMINFTCPIYDGTYIVIEGTTTTFTAGVRIEYTLYGTGFALSHSFWPGKNKKGRLAIQKITNISEEIRSKISTFWMDENVNFQVKFRVEGHFMRVQLGRKVITRYDVSQSAEINKLSIKADLTNLLVTAKYKIRHSYSWG